MEIREANRSDIKSLAILATKTFVDAFGHTYSHEDLKEVIEETRSEKYFEKALRRNKVLVVEDNGEIVAYSEFGDVESEYPVAGVVAGDQEIWRLYVLSSHQGKGIGKSLLEKMFSYPELQKARHVYLDVWEKNVGAQKLYKSYGFEETGVVADEEIYMVRHNQP